MQTYYPSLEAIHQQTMQLQSEQCTHCGQTHQLVSHGFVRKKRVGGDPQSVGKRVFCSNRHHHSGCGRTMQLYLDSTLRRMQHAGSTVVIFVLLLLTGHGAASAYTQATNAPTPRHAYRWLQRLFAQIATHRSLFHQPPPLLQPTAPPTESPPPTSAAPHTLRRNLLASTFTALLSCFKQPLCQTYQSQLQQAFL